MRTAIIWVTIVAGAVSFADAGFPTIDSSKPLSEVLNALQAAGYRSATSVEFEGGNWCIHALHNKMAVEIIVDPQSTRVVREVQDQRREALPVGATSLTTIVEGLEHVTFQFISTIGLEAGAWKAEVTKSGVQYTVTLDARTGELLRCRPR